jgi:hypothetical protein
MTTTTNIDTKGLTEAQVQYAIDNYIRERELAGIRASWKAVQEQEKQERRAKVALRAKHCNALKRAGVPVKTESDSWRARKADVRGYANAEGWHAVQLPQDARIVYLSRIQASPELEVKTVIETERYLGVEQLVENTYIRLIPKEA